MQKEGFVAMAIALFFVACPAKGLCQGAAEYSITTSHVATATVKAGSALDKATQQLSGHLNENLAKSTEQSRHTGRQPSRVPADQPAPTKAQTIKSANGIEVVCGPSDAKTARTEHKAGSQSEACVSSHGKDSPGSKPNLPSKPETEGKYPSVVSLSLPK